jgi:O-antigen ligase
MVSVPSSQNIAASPPRLRLNEIVTIVLALLAVSSPALLAYGLPPSATFLNQAMAFIGWGLFLFVLVLPAGLHMPTVHATGSTGTWALVAALLIPGVYALGTAVLASLPGGLAVSGAAFAAAAALTAGLAAWIAREGHGGRAFEAFCLALVVAGILSLAIAMVQIFLPQWADGDWIAGASGRAAGNLRQPNHLSSLLLWSFVAVLWLGEGRRLHRAAVAVLGTLFVFGVVLSASRTGVLGVLVLAAWGVLDRRLSRPARVLLLLAPLAYLLFWFGLSLWAQGAPQAFAGEQRFSTQGDYSSSRFSIWRNALTLMAQHPWLGVGWGEFNFAWTLTPFPDRPLEFFDHTHNLPLQLAVELGLPIAALVLLLLVYALWRAFAASRSGPVTRSVMLRSAFMMVLLMAVHSLLEYPLWYAYFLLPTVFAWGLCLGSSVADGPAGKPEPVSGQGPAASAAPVASGLSVRQFALSLAALAMAIGGVLSVADYVRVAAIFSPVEVAAPLPERIAKGQQSWFFAHHAHYAAVTTAPRPSEVMGSFKVATHYLLDTRLMIAWARAFHEAGDVERARHLAQRLREFRNPDADAFFAPCAQPGLGASELPFQCTPPSRAFSHRDFK